MKPLDFIKTKAGNIGIITEVSVCQGINIESGADEKFYSASVSFLNTFKGEKSAWWHEEECEVIDSLPDLLSRNLTHPFGTGSIQPFKLEG